MSRFGVFVAALFAGIVVAGTALAQGVPPRLLGDYAMGSCDAPQVSATIDERGVQIYDPLSGEVFADVQALSVSDRGDVVEIDVVLNGSEDGTLIVTIGDGTIDVEYQPDGGPVEPAETLLLCAAAEIPVQPPVTLATTVPDALLGEWVTGSCEAPQERLVVEPGALNAYDPGSSSPVAVVTVIDVEEIPGGVLVNGDYEGQAVGVELLVVGEDALDLVFIGPGGARDNPQSLMRCGAPPADMPPATAAELPEAYLGRYVVGETASCAAAETEVVFESTQLTVIEGGTRSLTIEVTDVIATEPDLVFAVTVGGEPGDVTMRRIGDATFEVVFTDGQGNSDRPETFVYCDGAAGPTEDGPIVTMVSEIPEAWLGTYAYDGGTCDDAAAGTYLLIEPTRLLVFDSGEQVFEIPVTGVTEIEPGLVFMAVVPGEGAGEIAMRPAGGNSYDVTLTEEGATSSDTDVFIRCDAAAGGPTEDGPAGEPVASTPTVPDAWLGRYAFGNDPGQCGPAEAGEYLVLQPTQLVMMDDGREEMTITVLAARASGESLVLEVFEDRLGDAEIAFDPAGGGVYDVTVTEPDGSTEDEVIVRCMAEATPPVDGPPVDVPTTAPVALELPAAYLGRYVLDHDGVGCAYTNNEVYFEPTRLVVYENGALEFEIAVLAVLATEPDLVFSASVAGEGDAEITVRAIGGDEYEVSVREAGSDRADTETLLFCPAGDGPDVPPMATDGSEVTQFLFDQSAAEFAALMAALEATCVKGSEQACLDTFYGFADVTGDGQLTQAELARITRFGTKWAVTEALPIPLDDGQKLAVHLATMVTGPLVADGLIYNFDYDDNGALSQAELFPGGAENAPIAIEALMRTFTEDTIESVFDALEELDDLM